MRRNHQLKPINRFRYWSRKGYAAFSSLGQCVTIGQLRKNVTERALTKQTEPGVLFTFDGRTNQTNSDADDAIAPIAAEAIIEMLLATLRPQTQSTYTAPYGSLLYKLNRGRDALNASCNLLNLFRRRAELQDAFNASLPVITHPL